MSGNPLKFEIESKTVAEFRKLHRAKELTLQPPYQRKLVWPNSAKVSLMETILLGYPIPEIYLAYETTPDGEQFASVVDGQQRLTALLQFIDNEYGLDGLEDETLGNLYEGRHFKELPAEVRRSFFEYRFPIRRLSNLSEEFVRSVFARVNRVNMVLTEQELRNAVLPGPFQEFLKDCAYHELSSVSGIFSPQRRQRGGDLEFFAESFGSCVFGLSNKKMELNERYDVLSANFDDYQEDAKSYIQLLGGLTSILKWEGRTRWSNIVDMFTLLHVTWEFREMFATPGDDRQKIRDLFELFQRAVSHYKRDGNESPIYVDSRLQLSRLLDLTEEEVETSVLGYFGGVRNSSDLGSRRSRSNNLRSLLVTLRSGKS